MADAVYSIVPGAAVALSASATKTVLGVKAHANSGIALLGVTIGFDGVTASWAPVLCELAYCTWATNSPGTNSTSVTPLQTGGRVLTAGFTAARNWTAEPTTITVFDELLVPADKGLVKYDIPLGLEPDSALAEGFVIRCITAASVTPNFRGSMRVKRI